MSNKYPTPASEDSMNNHFNNLLKMYKNTIESDGEDIKDNPHTYYGTIGKQYNSTTDGNLMKFTTLLESLGDINNSVDNIEETPIENDSINEMPEMNDTVNEEAIINELNKLFTPILVMQGFENQAASQINEAFSEAEVLTEKNMISYDNNTRMAQLIAICALLIAKQKNSPKYQMYQQATQLKNKMKLGIQKDEYDTAKDIAQKFLVKIATTNNSSVTRDAAKELLPETQH